MGTSPIPSLVFPWYFGPRVLGFGSALLWFGQLNCVNMPFASPRPVEAFKLIRAHARERGHALSELLEIAAHHCFVGTSVSLGKTLSELEGVEDKIKRIALVGPGGQGQYRSIREQWQPEIGRCVLELLDDLELLRVACSQLVWRCYEYYLESNESVDAVIDVLASEEQVINGKSSLLAHCLANHYLSFGFMPSAVVAGNAKTTHLLATLFQASMPQAELSSVRLPATLERSQVASTLFENVVASLCPSISSRTARFYSRALDQHGEAVEASRRKCYLAADRLIDKRERPEAFKSLWEQTLAELQNEVQEIAELDASAWRSFIAQLREDRIVWTSLTAMLVTAVGGLPEIALAAAATTLFATLGTKAFAQRRENLKTLEDSDWCYVYQLHDRVVRIPRKMSPRRAG
jgi:hypothetical protein